MFGWFCFQVISRSRFCSTRPPTSTVLGSRDSLYSMDTYHAPSKRDTTRYTGRIGSEAYKYGIWCDNDQSSVASSFSNMPLQTKQSSPTCTPKNTRSAAESISGMGAPLFATSQSDQAKVDPQLTKTPCLRCRSKKSRCSRQRPCGGCISDGLDCVWDDDGSKPKTRNRKSKSAKGAGTGTEVTKKKDAPLQVRSACKRCQHRKAKCSGTRPACTYCVEHQLDCSYSVAEGTTRTNDLKRKLKESEIRAHAFGRVLAVMREGNIHQATEVLARLRLGESLRIVLQSLPTSGASPDSGNE